MELSERCIQILEKEGFPYVYEWKDEPSTLYPTHTHQDKVSLFITEGSIELLIAEERHTLQAGNRFDIPPLVPHSAIVGLEGCQYVVGEMIEGDS